MFVSEYRTFCFSHLNQLIKKEKQDGVEISPYTSTVTDIEKMVEIGAVSVHTYAEYYHSG